MLMIDNIYVMTQLGWLVRNRFDMVTFVRVIGIIMMCVSWGDDTALFIKGTLSRFFVFFLIN